jgi:hypothetical protein
MKYTTINNIAWGDVEKKTILCNVNFKNLGVVKFTASPLDTEAHGQEIYKRVVAGDFGPIAPYVALPTIIPTISPLQALLWLSMHGKGDADVRAVINSIPDVTTKLQTLAYWDRAVTLAHDHPFIIELWSAFGITVPVDQAFIEAATL